LPMGVRGALSVPHATTDNNASFRDECHQPSGSRSTSPELHRHDGRRRCHAENYLTRTIAFIVGWKVQKYAKSPFVDAVYLHDPLL
jgi:hypothetical protein